MESYDEEAERLHQSYLESCIAVAGKNGHNKEKAEECEGYNSVNTLKCEHCPFK
jgi:hypothetical protein